MIELGEVGWELSEDQLLKKVLCWVRARHVLLDNGRWIVLVD